MELSLSRYHQNLKKAPSSNLSKRIVCFSQATPAHAKDLIIACPRSTVVHSYLSEDRSDLTSATYPPKSRQASSLEDDTPGARPVQPFTSTRIREALHILRNIAPTTVKTQTTTTPSSNNGNNALSPSLSPSDSSSTSPGTSKSDHDSIPSKNVMEGDCSQYASSSSPSSVDAETETVFPTVVPTLPPSQGVRRRSALRKKCLAVSFYPPSFGLPSAGQNASASAAAGGGDGSWNPMPIPGSGVAGFLMADPNPQGTVESMGRDHSLPFRDEGYNTVMRQLRAANALDDSVVFDSSSSSSSSSS
eukprot:CAMPEP_0175061296 /NCGR_PEP_ID=MMETSP0052_2-20121109/13505_1 /TAXON_ID=51329 ORGANISM="Polytomella parva, Strain SAG 63-3" /NCGR_SAMPLE_ID=MMETSP0052_2 /ASSEMBLY_ACC=CAM_ASM_000194 /LENGTH=303 /DNA_ID=CAMNT_0016327133 /DNA_START=28 /DNA_END=936 /DNA_ORIENTATION=-